jgi:hypothetical protein
VLRMLRAWLNRADAPMLGLDFAASSSSSSSSSSSDGGGGQQHARRLQQTLSEYLPGSPLASSSSSSSSGSDSSSIDGRWWQQQQQKGDAAQSRQPLLPTLLPAAGSLESGSSSSSSDPSPMPATATDGSSSGSASNAWWTKRAHIGGASTNLAGQAKGASADSTAQDSLQVPPSSKRVTPGNAAAASMCCYVLDVACVGAAGLLGCTSI